MSPNRKNTMNTYLQRLKDRRREEAADVVQTVLLIAGFVIVAVIIVIWLGTAMLNKGADTSACIETVKAPSVQQTDDGTEGQCAAINHSSERSFTSTSEYAERY